MIITNKRILLIRTTSAIKGAVIGGAVGGALGAVIASSMAKNKEKNTITAETINQLLSADGKNISIALEDLASVKLKKGWLSTDIWIFPVSGKKLHLGINNKKYFDEWKPIFEYSIPEKLVLQQ
jgi:hypothetical protein